MGSRAQGTRAQRKVRPPCQRSHGPLPRQPAQGQEGRRMLSSAGLLVCGASFLASTGNSWQLTGKGYESDARLPALLARANEALGRALERVQGELGWKARQPPIRWAFDVSLPPEPTDATPGGEKKFFDAGSTAFLREGFVQVTLPGRKYLQHPEGVDHVIEHEAVHAVLASCLGTRERYSAVPRWFRE